MLPKFIKLNNNKEIPTVGLGTYKSPAGQVEKAVKYAIEVGYRHIDCAWFYRNENEIGNAINEKITDGTVKREDLFIVTKLWNNYHAREKVVPMLKQSLADLHLNYVDLYLIHWPFGFKEEADPLPKDSSGYSNVDYLETWKGMEDCVRKNLAKSIGLSNFNIEQMGRVLNNSTIKPVVNQVEVNPNLNQKDLINFCKKMNVVVVGFCPLGRGVDFVTNDGTHSTLADPKIAEIGKKYKKSPAQVILNYLVSLGVVVIPKSITKSRILENSQIFDFTLDPEDAAYMDSCNKNVRVSPMTAYKDHMYYPF